MLWNHAIFQLVLTALLVNGQSENNVQDFLAPSSWPTGPGRPLRPQVPDAELASILRQVDKGRIRAIVEKLVSFGTRHTLSNQTDPARGIGAARDWIAAELREYAKASGGRMEVSAPGYIQTPLPPRVPADTLISNVQATLRGSEEPERVYVVSGHYDSRVSDVLNFVDDAPGANDDASGTAISMELARVFAKYKPKATIVFTAVAGEEQGLLGSQFQARTFRNASVDVQGMLDNDIVGSSRGGDGIHDPFNLRMFVQGIPPTETLPQVTARANIGAERDTPTHQLARFTGEVASNALTGMNVRTIFRPDRYLRGGDHLSFLRAGYPAIRFTEPNEDYAHQHQDIRVDSTGKQYGDLIEFCDFDFIARVARVNGAALWSLAQAPGTPKNVTVDARNLTNNSTLRWVLDERAVGYEVVWRPTDAPTWTHVIDVGKVPTATVDLSKDNVQFAVRAVGAGGYKSPAGFPFPG